MNNMTLDEFWNKVCESSADATVHHSLGWRDLMGDVYGLNHDYQILDSNKHPTLLTLFKCRSYNGSIKYTNMPFVNFTPPIGPSSCNEVVVEYLDMRRKSDGSFVELKLPYRLDGELCRKYNLSEYEMLVNSTVPLEHDYESQKKKMSSNLRNNLQRRSNLINRERIVIEETSRKENIEEFYRIMAYLYKDVHRMPFHPEALFHGIMQRLKNNCRLVVAKHNKSVIGGSLILFNNKHCHYAWAASKREYRNVGLDSLMLNDHLKYAISRGCMTLSLGTSAPEQNGLLRFKSEWGSNQSPTYIYCFGSHNMPLRPGSPCSFLRRAYSILPFTLAKKLMPIVVRYLA